MKILRKRINKLKEWIKFCYSQKNNEFIERIRKVKKIYIDQLKRLDRYEIISENRLKQCINDPYGAWNKIKRLLNKNKLVLSMNAFEIQSWIKEFEDQFRSTISFIPQAGCLEDELWNSKKIENIIKSLPNRKAPGPDNITNEIIKKEEI